jgi:hypothetical protein
MQVLGELTAIDRVVRRKMFRTEVAIALLIFVVGAMVGIRAVQMYRAVGYPEYFYQSDFGPAVMVACAGRLEDPDTRNAPALAAFLLQRSDTFDCAALDPTMPMNPMNGFQAASQYLELAVGLTWKLTGVSWSRLAVLPGMLFGAVAALTYGVLRLGLSRALALLALVPSVTSTPNFMQVPHLRDYAKGPFLLAVILIMGLVVLRTADRRRLILWASLAGVVVGSGLGFRTDLLIALVPFAIAVALLVPPALSLRVRMVAIGVFLVSFVAVAFPVLRAMSNSGNTGHIVMLGLGADFDGPLRIEPSVYEFGGRYVDSLAFTTINSYAIRIDGRTRAAEGGSPEYNRVANAYLARIAGTFPADVMTRVAAAIRATPKYFLDSSLYPPVQVQSEHVRTVYALRARALWRIAHIAFMAFAAATLLVSAANPRAGWLIVLVMIGFAGSSAIQFHERHFYYLQFVPWLAFGLLAQAAIARRKILNELTSHHVRRAMIFGAVVGCATGGVIIVSRAYQQRAVAQLFSRYETAVRAPIDALRKPAGPGRILIASEEWQHPLPPGSQSIETRFIAVHLNDDLCGPGDLPLTIRYDGRRRDADLSEPITARLHPTASMPTTVFVVAYDWADDYIRFRGIEVAADQAHCVTGLSYVEGLERSPLLLTTTLGAGWREERLYQRLR